MKRALALVLCVLMLFTLVGCTSGGATKMGLATLSSVAKSKDVAADADGLAQADTIIAAIVLDGGGKILKADIESVQAKVNFDAAGKVKTDVAAEVKNKTEAGDAYGMKKASGIGKEWFEQIDALEKWLIGKTADQVSGMKLTDGKSTDADLMSSVTITLTDYQKVVLKAIQNAK